MSVVDPFVHGVEGPVRKLGCCCAGSSLCLPGTSGLFPRLLGNAEAVSTAGGGITGMLQAEVVVLFLSRRKWFPLVHLWWDAIVARPPGLCMAVDLSKDVSETVQPVELERGTRCLA